MAQFPSRRAALLVSLLVLNSVWAVVSAALPKLRYDAVVVHHTASDHGDFRTVRRAHHSRKWMEIAYHLVLSNGSTEVPFGHLYATWRYRLGLWSVATRSPRFNVRAVHVSVVGNFDQAAPPEEMQAVLGSTLSQLLERHRISSERIFLHRDCSPTACPGQFISRDDLARWMDLAAQAPAEIQAQHRAALGGPSIVAVAAWLVAHGMLWLFFSRRAASRGRRSPEGRAGPQADPSGGLWNEQYG